METKTDMDLFQNAVYSIELGIEDFHSSDIDQKRAVSAVRNFYAGVLLFMKETLRRTSPELIYRHLVPTSESDGIKWVQAENRRGKKRTETISRIEIEKRWKSLGLEDVAWRKLKEIAEIRNNIEHFTPGRLDRSVGQVIHNSYVLLVDILSNHLGENLREVFQSDIVDAIIEENDAHMKLFDICMDSWEHIFCQIPDSIRPEVEQIIYAELECPHCLSGLIKSSETGEYPGIELLCEDCGETFLLNVTLSDIIPYCLEDEKFLSPGGISLPVLRVCQNCGEYTYFTAADCCAICLHNDDPKRCVVCSSPLSSDKEYKEKICTQDFQELRKRI